MLAVAVAAAILGPRIDESKEERAERERRAQAAALAERKREQREIQRPRFGSVAVTPIGAQPAATPPAEALRERRALVDAAIGKIVADARSRFEGGELDRRAIGGECEPFPVSAATPDPREQLDLRRGTYQCLAKTVEQPGSEFHISYAFGYPYRLQADFGTGRYAYCRLALEAGEGSYRGRPLVPLPPACGA